MPRALKHLDKVLLGICLALFLAAAAYSTVGFGRIDEISARGPGAGLARAPYEAAPAQIPVIETVKWSDPSPQSRGPDWVYDVFSPPVIYYNRETGEFTVTPPTYAAPVAATDGPPFELELLEVRQEPYRIQLIGHAGAEGSYLGVFDLMESGQTVVARPGTRVSSGEFQLRSFELRKIVTTSPDSMPVVDSAAVAVILDERTGRDETLTSGERKMLPRLQALFRLNTSPPEERVLREGMTVDVKGLRYFVTQLSLMPQQAVVSRRATDALGSSETRTLQPAASRK